MRGAMQSARERPEPSASSRRGRFPSPAISARVASAELRRGLRRIREQDVWLAIIAVSALVVVVSLPLVFGITRDMGAEMAAGDAAHASALVIAFAALWLLFFGISISSGVGSYGEVDNAAGMLTIRPPKDVAGGLLASSALWLAPYVVAPIVALAGLAAGAGTPLPLVAGLVASALLLVTSVALGYPVGLALKGAIRRSDLLTRLKPVLGAVVVVAYFWIMFAGHLFTVVDAVEPALRASPIGWLGELALLTTPGADVSTARAAGGLVFALAALPVGTLATVRAARYAWYVDAARSSDDGAEESDEREANDAASERLAAALAPVARRPGTLGVATTTLVRAYRSPLQLVFVALPLLFALPTFERIVATGTAPEYTPWFVTLYGAWAAGAAFPLNVLGNQGPTLPTLLTARAGGRQVVHGAVAAAVVPFAPVTAALAAGGAHLAGRDAAGMLAVGGVALVVVTAGSVLAAGFGARFPRFGTIDVGGDRTARPPSKAAFALFSVAMTLAVTAVGVLTDEIFGLLVAAMLSEHLPFGIDVSAGELETISWALAALLVAAVPAAYVVAVRRVDGYRLD